MGDEGKLMVRSCDVVVLLLQGLAWLVEEMSKVA